MDAEVLLISRRPEISAALSSLMGNTPINASVRLQPPGRRCTARRSAFAALDVAVLFPQWEPGAVPLGQFLDLLVVGFRADQDAVLAAAHAGVPLFILEDLKPATFARLLPASSLRCEPYRGFTRLAAEKIGHLLERRMKQRELTPREWSILRLLVEGRTNAEIGAALCVEVKTVKNHLTRLFEKLEVSNRLEAVARYHEMETVPPEATRNAI